MVDKKEEKVNKSRIWLFIVLVAIGAGLMLVAWFMPWWTIDVEGFACDVVQIRPWGLEICEQMGDFAILMKGAEMPVWFGPLMWAYLAACMIALLVGAFIRGMDIKIGKFQFSLSQLLVGGVGFSYLFAGVFAAVYAAYRMRKAFDVPLVGRAFIDMGDPIIAYVDTRLLPGYYMIYVAGLVLLLVGIFRDKITGEAKTAS